jgi:hypothetical protein
MTQRATVVVVSENPRSIAHAIADLKARCAEHPVELESITFEPPMPPPVEDALRKARAVWE